MDDGRLILGISPYHLTTREVPAMAALLLGERVVTAVPTPDDLVAPAVAAGAVLDAGKDDEGRRLSREQFAEAVERSPRYLRLMESWRWGACLWKSGVIGGSYAGRTPMGEFLGVIERIDTDESLSPLRPIFANLPMGETHGPRLLDELSADVLKGGPNPAMTIPLAAAMDRFAAEHGVVVVRAGATSLAQRAEMSMGKKVFSCAVPVLLSADGVRVARARLALEASLDALRAAMVRAFREHGGTAAAAKDVMEAAQRYTEAFMSTPGVVAGDDDEGQRVRWGYVSVMGAVLPGDCVLRSSKAAVRTMRGEVGTPDGAGGNGGGGGGGGSSSRVCSLVIKEMSLKPA